MKITYEGKNPKWRCHNCGTELIFTAESPIKAIKEFCFFCPKCMKTWRATHPTVKDKAIISGSRFCPFLITAEEGYNRCLRCFLREERKRYLICPFKPDVWDRGFYEPHYFDCGLFKTEITKILKRSIK